jgi:hypothetical protein
LIIGLSSGRDDFPLAAFQDGILPAKIGARECTCHRDQMGGGKDHSELSGSAFSILLKWMFKAPFKELTMSFDLKKYAVQSQLNPL